MTYREAYARALRFLNVRFLSEGEFRRKLARYDVEDDVVDAVIEQLKQERFVDDMRLAEAVYKQYARKKCYGRAYIVQCLRRRYLPVPDLEEVLDEAEAAKALAARRFKGGGDPGKMARFLQYRGFSPAVIRQVLDYFYS